MKVIPYLKQIYMSMETNMYAVAYAYLLER